MLLADVGSHQDFEISASVTLSGTATNGGLVFAAPGNKNFWLYMADRSGGNYKLYEVTYSGGTYTFTQRGSGGTVSGAGGTFTLSCEVRSGAIEQMGNITDYAATIPAGQVGVWVLDTPRPACRRTCRAAT